MCLWCWERADWITPEIGSSVFINHTERSEGSEMQMPCFQLTVILLKDLVEGNKQTNKPRKVFLRGRDRELKNKNMNQPFQKAAVLQQRSVGNIKWHLQLQPRTNVGIFSLPSPTMSHCLHSSFLSGSLVGWWHLLSLPSAMGKPLCAPGTAWHFDGKSLEHCCSHTGLWLPGTSRDYCFHFHPLKVTGSQSLGGTEHSLFYMLNSSWLEANGNKSMRRSEWCFNLEKLFQNTAKYNIAVINTKALWALVYIKSWVFAQCCLSYSQHRWFFHFHIFLSDSILCLEEEKLKYLF